MFNDEFLFEEQRDNGRKKHEQTIFTAIIEREGDGYVSLRPEIDIASQGKSVEEARRNLR
jgi:hypothetical protein